MRLRRFQFYSRTVFSCKDSIIDSIILLVKFPLIYRICLKKFIFCPWIYYRIFSTNKIRELQTVRFEIGIRIAEKLCCESAVRLHNFFIVLSRPVKFSRIICFHFKSSYQIYFYNDLKNSCAPMPDWSLAEIFKRLRNARKYCFWTWDRLSGPVENCSDDMGKTHQKYLFVKK